MFEKILYAKCATGKRCGNAQNQAKDAYKRKWYWHFSHPIITSFPILSHDIDRIIRSGTKFGLISPSAFCLYFLF